MSYLISILIAICIVILCYIYLKWRYSYWKRVGLNYLEPDFFFGNTKDLLSKKISVGDQFAKLYRELKRKGWKHGGAFSFFRPVYIPVDLDLIKNIMVSDFDYFVNHGVYFNEEVNPLSGHLFNLEDQKWKRMRNKVTPSFTSSNLKMMYQTVFECSVGLKDLLAEKALIQDAVDIKEALSRFTTDVIGTVAFGLDFNSLKQSDSKFRENGKKFFDDNWKQQLRQLIVFVIHRDYLRALKFPIFDEGMEKFFMDVIRRTIEYRENNNVFRKDFIHMMLQLKNRGKIADDEFITKREDEEVGSDIITFNELAAQCFLFFIAGFETSATTMTFALLEMALNPDIQDKLREEIKIVLKNHNGELTFDNINEMKYLTQVIYETLRKHPPAPALPRICTKTYQVPNTDIVLEKDTNVVIPVLGIQHDPDIYPNPQRFDPERFSAENIATRKPCAFMSFGEGPRYCLGSRFGLLETKVGIISVLDNFKVELHKKTKLPIKYVTNAFILAVDGGVWLKISKVN